MAISAHAWFMLQMMRVLRLTALFALAGASIAAAQQPASPYEAEVATYEARDRSAPPPSGAIVFVGSSSIRRWNLEHSFPDLKTVNRGINGSTMSDAVRFVDRIVIPYSPRIVVVYAGDNDLDGGALAEQVAVWFERFVRLVRARLPGTRIVYIGIKPSLQRWDVIERIRIANGLIRAYAAHDDNIAFVDVDQAMLGWNDEPRRELFLADGLHLSAEGYELWTTLLRPLLVASDDARR